MEERVEGKTIEIAVVQGPTVQLWLGEEQKVPTKRLWVSGSHGWVDVWVHFCFCKVMLHTSSTWG